MIRPQPPYTEPMAVATKSFMTEAEYDALLEEDYEGFKVELDEGELVLTASPDFLHNRVRDRLGRILAVYAEKGGLGEVTWESDFWLAHSTIRIPDLGFLRTENSPPPGTTQRTQGAPDLCIEVISPSNRARDMARKVQQYLKAGATVVWIIYPNPDERFVNIYRAGCQPEMREGNDLLDCPELLPGWSLPLADLFKGL